MLGLTVGLKNGIEETVFLTFIKDNNKYALVKNYGSEKIAVKIKDKKFTSEYILLGNITDLELKREIISHNVISGCK